MAGGILGFLGFGKKNKVNQVQNFRMPPSASEAPLYPDLRQLASQRIKAGTTGEETPGVGFGPGFLDRATSAPIASREARYREVEMPQLSAELSKRGIARSAGPGLASDIVTRAGQSKERDINDLLANFYVLNEQMKKSDITEGIKVGDQLDTQFLNQGNEQASQFNAAERGNTERTAGVAAQNNANSLARQNQVIGTLLSAINPDIGSSWNSGVVQPQNTNTPLKGVGNSSSVKLQGSSNEDFEAWLNSIFG